MHNSVMDFLKAHLCAEEIVGKRVAEIGSQDVNGTPRTVVISGLCLAKTRAKMTVPARSME